MMLIKFLPALLVGVLPIAVIASECPEPPVGMEYETVDGIRYEASMNDASFVQCLREEKGSVWGEGYHFKSWICPSFSLVHRDLGMVAAVRKSDAVITRSLSPASNLMEKWFVIDKNGREWSAWEEDVDYKYKKYRKHANKNKSFKEWDDVVQIEEKSKLVQNICQRTKTIKLKVENINLIVNGAYTQKLVKEPAPPVPAF